VSAVGWRRGVKPSAAEHSVDVAVDGANATDDELDTDTELESDESLDDDNDGTAKRERCVCVFVCLM
jgi:hypothetical protein